jgi:hypothetical protein
MVVMKLKNYVSMILLLVIAIVIVGAVFAAPENQGPVTATTTPTPEPNSTRDYFIDTTFLPLIEKESHH